MSSTLLSVLFLQNYNVNVGSPSSRSQKRCRLQVFVAIYWLTNVSAFTCILNIANLHFIKQFSLLQFILVFLIHLISAAFLNEEKLLSNLVVYAVHLVTRLNKFRENIVEKPCFYSGFILFFNTYISKYPRTTFMCLIQLDPLVGHRLAEANLAKRKFLYTKTNQ